MFFLVQENALLLCVSFIPHENIYSAGFVYKTDACTQVLNKSDVTERGLVCW